MANYTTVVIDNFSNSMITTSPAVDNVSNATTTSPKLDPPERSWIYWAPGPIICGFGIVCNVLNLCVLLQKQLRRDSPYIYLTALAVSDLTLLSASFIHLVRSITTDRTPFDAYFDAYVFFATSNIFFNASVWLIVVMTIERVCFVIHPLTMRSSKWKTRCTVVVIFIICALINIPRYFCYEIIPYKGSVAIKGTTFRHSVLFYRISWFHAVVINFIPLLILIITNSVLIHALHKAQKERELMSRASARRGTASRREQTRLNRTLVSIVVIFFICTTPSAFVEDPIAYSLFGGKKTWHDYLRSPSNQNFIYVSNLLLFVNSSVNFILYCAFNQRFRTAMGDFFRKFSSRQQTLVNTNAIFNSAISSMRTQNDKATTSSSRL